MPSHLRRADGDWNDEFLTYKGSTTDWSSPTDAWLADDKNDGKAWSPKDTEGKPLRYPIPNAEAVVDWDEKDSDGYPVDDKPVRTPPSLSLATLARSRLPTYLRLTPLA